MNFENYWDRLYECPFEGHLHPRIAEYKGKVHLRLIGKWTDDLEGKWLLKTDLFEECFGEDHFLDKLTSEHKFGIDISKRIVRHAQLRVGNFQGVAAEIQELPFGDEKFDVIISNSTLDHVERDKVPHSLEELNRVLKRGGSLILTIDNKHNPLYSIGMLIGQKTGYLPFYQDKCYSIGEFDRLLAARGFEIEAVDAIFHIPPPLSHFTTFLSTKKPHLADKIASWVIRISEKLHNKSTWIFTGRLLSFKARKVE